MKIKRAMMAITCALVLFASLVLCATSAEAKTITYLESVTQAPETTAYFNPIKASNITSLSTSSRVGQYNASGNPDEFWYEGYVFYLNENEYGYFYVENAVTVNVQNIGFTVDGKQLDGSISFSVEGKGSQHTTDGLRAPFLVLNCNTNRVSWECTSISATQDWKSSGLECAQTTVWITMHLYEHSSGAPFSGRLALYVADLDVGQTALPEQVRLGGGFANDVYVSSQTELNRQELEASQGTHFVATTLFEPTSFKNGFVAYIDSEWCDFSWSGTACGTEFGPIFETYPSSQVKDPQKSIVAIDGKAPEATVPTVKRGAIVDFSITQTFPYCIETNVPERVEMRDELDARLNWDNYSVRIYKEPVDELTPERREVTSEWNISRAGAHELACIAMDAKAIGGTYTLEIKGLQIEANCETGALYNKSQTYVKLMGEGDIWIQKQSNTVQLNIVPRYEKLVITKTINTNDVVEAHGVPVFFFTLTGTRYGKSEVASAYVSFDDIHLGQGEVSKTCEIDLSGFDYGATLSEQPSLRYALATLSSPNKDARVQGETLYFNLAGSQDGTTLSATFVNKKVFQEKTSSTALMRNEVKQ